MKTLLFLLIIASVGCKEMNMPFIAKTVNQDSINKAIEHERYIARCKSVYDSLDRIYLKKLILKLKLGSDYQIIEYQQLQYLRNSNIDAYNALVDAGNEAGNAYGRNLKEIDIISSKLDSLKSIIK